MPNKLPKRNLVVKSLVEDAKTHKLMAMGILPGSQVDILRKGPWGKVYYIKVDGQNMALRQQELDVLLFDKQEEA